MATLARVMISDPPWMHTDRIQGKKRGAAKHYKCMTLSEIMRMPLPPIHEDAVLFLWRVSSMVEEAYEVVRAWGFVPKSEIVWNKVTDETGEKEPIGMGHIVRGSHETCIVARRGKLIKPESKSERTSFRAPIGAHSEKPEAFYRIVERLYPLELWPEAHVETFARRRRKGWIQFGDELPPLESPTCLIHGPYTGSHCSACDVTATGAALRAMLNGDSVARGWEATRQALAREPLL